MPLSRRGLFSVLAGAPAAAVGMVALPAKGEQARRQRISRPRFVSVGEDGPEAITPLRRGANGKLGIDIQGDWRAR